jgi:hypothetical protein
MDANGAAHHGHSPRTPRVGDRVRIQRDENLYPAKGTWSQFRRKTGTVVEINLGEYGVVFAKVSPRTDGRGAFNHGGVVTWFQVQEVVVLARHEPTQIPREAHGSGQEGTQDPSPAPNPHPPRPYRRSKRRCEGGPATGNQVIAETQHGRTPR